MTPNYKADYTPKNDAKRESLFHSLDLAKEFAVMMNGIVLNNKEA